MHDKPDSIDAYDPAITEACERVLVTLLRGLGPWKTSIILVGGLVPRYLVTKRPPDVPAHAGTVDVDVVVALQILAETEAYKTLEKNLKDLGFQRALNEHGVVVNWRWQIKTPAGTVILEFLADNPKVDGGRMTPLPSKGNLSALNIPYSSIVFDHHTERALTAELLDGKGVATESIRHADIVSLVCLKAYAFDDTLTRQKDPHDMLYCLEHGEGGLDAAADAFAIALKGKHVDVINGALAILNNRFCNDTNTEGYKKDGPVAVATFELGKDGDREARILRQRNVATTIMVLLQKIEAASDRAEPLPDKR